MRLTFVIAASILFGLVAYAKLLSVATRPSQPPYSALPITSPVHVAHIGVTDREPN
jgi:hypothetical protein